MSMMLRRQLGVLLLLLFLYPITVNSIQGSQTLTQTLSLGGLTQDLLAQNLIWRPDSYHYTESSESDPEQKLVSEQFYQDYGNESDYRYDSNTKKLNQNSRLIRNEEALNIARETAQFQRMMRNLKLQKGQAAQQKRARMVLERHDSNKMIQDIKNKAQQDAEMILGKISIESASDSESDDHSDQDHTQSNSDSESTDSLDDPNIYYKENLNDIKGLESSLQSLTDQEKQMMGTASSKSENYNQTQSSQSPIISLSNVDTVTKMKGDKNINTMKQSQSKPESNFVPNLTKSKTQSSNQNVKSASLESHDQPVGMIISKTKNGSHHHDSIPKRASNNNSRKSKKVTTATNRESNSRLNDVKFDSNSFLTSLKSLPESDKEVQSIGSLMNSNFDNGLNSAPLELSTTAVESDSGAYDDNVNDNHWETPVLPISSMSFLQQGMNIDLASAKTNLNVNTTISNQFRPIKMKHKSNWKKSKHNRNPEQLQSESDFEDSNYFDTGAQSQSDAEYATDLSNERHHRRKRSNNVEVAAHNGRQNRLHRTSSRGKKSSTHDRHHHNHVYHHKRVNNHKPSQAQNLMRDSESQSSNSEPNFRHKIQWKKRNKKKLRLHYNPILMEPTDTDPITKLQRDLGFDVNEHESDHSVYHRSSLSLDEFEKESENEISQSKSESLSNTHIKNKPRGVSKSVIAVAVDKEIQTQPMQEPSLASPVTSSKQSKTILPPGSTNKIHSISKSAGALQKQTSNGKSDQNIKTTVTSAESPSQSVDLVQSKKNLNLKTQNTDSMTKNSNNNQNLQSTIQEEIRKQIASLGNSVNPTVEAYANPQLRMTTSVQKPEIAEYQSVSGPGTNEPSESESPHHLMKVLSELNDLVGSPSQSELRERRLKKKEAEIQRRERKLKQEGIVMKRLLLKGKRMMQDLIETHEHQSKQFGNHQSRSTSQSNKNHILWPQQNQSQSQNQMMQNFNQGQNQNQNSNTYHGTQAGNEYTSPNPSWFTPERVEGSLADQQVNSISNSAALIQTTSDKSKTSDSESSVKTAAVSSEGISRNKTLNWFRRFIGKLYKSR